MATIEVNGVGLHVEVDGDDGLPPLVVLHGGLGLDHQLYRRSLAPLTDRFRLVHLDQRGNGRSVPADLATMTMEQLADDVAALADALGLDRFTVLGHSFGGFVAQELAIRHPGRVDGLVLVDTTPGQLGDDESPDDEQGPPPPPELLAMMSSFPSTDEEMAEGIEAMLPFYFPDFDLSRVAPLAEGTIYRVGAMVRGFELLAGWSSVDRLRQVTVPVLLLAGRRDVFTSFPQSHRIARRLPDAEVVILDESGHFPWIMEPDAFFAAVREWAGRKLPAGPSGSSTW